jgi:hypothetical protein
MVALIAEGARRGVVYSNDVRIREVGTLSQIDDVEQRFVAAVDRFRAACEDANITARDSLQILANTLEEIPRAHRSTWKRDRMHPIGPLAAALRDLVKGEFASGHWPDGFMKTFYEHLCHARPGFQKGVRYQDYLSGASAFFFGW